LLVGVQVGGHGGLDAETAEKSAQKPVVDPTRRVRSDVREAARIGDLERGLPGGALGILGADRVGEDLGEQFVAALRDGDRYRLPG
jgi:hypothetical protein